MMFLWLPMLAMFVLALVYFAVLCLYELSSMLRSRRRGEKPAAKVVTPLTSVKRLTAELRFMTREMSPLFGFGDD